MNYQLSTKEVQLTKTEIANIANDMVAKVTDGDIKALEALSKLSFMQSILEDAIKQIRPLAVDEADLYGIKSFKDYGVDFQVKEAGVKYDYSGDDEWRMLQDNIDAIRIEQKARELILKQSNRAPKTSTTTVTVIFPK